MVPASGTDSADSGGCYHAKPVREKIQGLEHLTVTYNYNRVTQDYVIFKKKAASERLQPRKVVNNKLIYALCFFLSKASEPSPSKAIVVGSGIDMAPLKPLPPE